MTAVCGEFLVRMEEALHLWVEDVTLLRLDEPPPDVVRRPVAASCCSAMPRSLASSRPLGAVPAGVITEERPTAVRWGI